MLEIKGNEHSYQFYFYNKYANLIWFGFIHMFGVWKTQFFLWRFIFKIKFILYKLVCKLSSVWVVGLGF